MDEATFVQPYDLCSQIHLPALFPVRVIIVSIEFKVCRYNILFQWYDETSFSPVAGTKKRKATSSSSVGIPSETMESPSVVSRLNSSDLYRQLAEQQQLSASKNEILHSEPGNENAKVQLQVSTATIKHMLSLIHNLESTSN